jgi:hypothetical protein
VPRIALMLVALSAVACGGLQSRPSVANAANVKISADPPPAGCSGMGLVSFRFVKGAPFRCQIDDARAAIRAEALRRGATYMRIGGMVDAGADCTGSAEAYTCPAP